MFFLVLSITKLQLLFLLFQSGCPTILKIYLQPTSTKMRAFQHFYLYALVNSLHAKKEILDTTDLNTWLEKQHLEKTLLAEHSATGKAFSTGSLFR